MPTATSTRSSASPCGAASATSGPSHTYLGSLGGPLPYMRRLAQIEAETAAHLGASPRPTRSTRAIPAPGGASQSMGLRAVNDLIDRHNRWFPIESRLPMDPKTARLRQRRRAPYRLRATRRRVGARAVSGIDLGRVTLPRRATTRPPPPRARPRPRARRGQLDEEQLSTPSSRRGVSSRSRRSASTATAPCA